MGTPHAIRQRQYAERQRARGLRLRRIWLSDEQASSVRAILHDGPANGHNHDLEADLVTTREALRQAQAEASRFSTQLTKAQADLKQALARIHDLEADLAQLSRVNAALRANLSDARRAARTAVVGVVVVGVIAAAALLIL